MTFEKVKDGFLTVGDWDLRLREEINYLLQ